MFERAILHIGAGKTGTSAIQTGLARNREKLQSLGVVYPADASDGKAVSGHVTGGNGIEIKRLLAADPEDVGKAAGRLETAIADIADGRSGGTLLYSAEVLGGAAPDRLELVRDILGARAGRIEIIYYVRHVADHILSNYGEEVRRRGMTGGIADFVAGYKRSFRKTLETYRSVFGDAAVSVHLYERHKHDVLNSFLKNIGFDAVEAAAVETVNRSLTRKELEIVRRLNTVKGARAVIAKLAVNLARTVERAREPFRLTAAELAAIGDKFGGDIAWINDTCLTTDTLLLHSEEIELAEDVSVAFSEDDLFYIRMLQDLVAIQRDRSEKVEKALKVSRNRNAALRKKLAALESGPSSRRKRITGALLGLGKRD